MLDVSYRNARGRVAEPAAVACIHATYGVAAATIDTATVQLIAPESGT